MSADIGAIFADVKRRLVAMAENPPYRFKKTSQLLIDAYRRRLTSFAGYSDSEVSEAEKRLGVRFPTVFREHLLKLGRNPGDLFCGSDRAEINDFEESHAEALKLMAETETDSSLPPNAVVFLFHHGYTFLYLVADGGFDSPIFQFTEGDPELKEIASGFVALMDGEIQLMEEVHRSCHESGGYYLTLHEDGGATEEHPALSSGDRPLDQSDGSAQ